MGQRRGKDCANPPHSSLSSSPLIHCRHSALLIRAQSRVIYPLPPLSSSFSPFVQALRSTLRLYPPSFNLVEAFQGLNKAFLGLYKAFLGLYKAFQGIDKDSLGLISPRWA